MKFSLLAEGTRAEKVINFPGLASADGTPVRLALRPLTGAEEGAVVARAIEFAKAKGTDDARRGHPLFDLAAMAHTLALACVDPDSPASAREPFFDGGANQVLERVGRETIAYLYERHEAWQAECSPYTHQMGAEELLDAARKEATSADDTFFSRLSPATRWSFTHILACAVVTSPEASSLIGSLCAASGPTSSAPPPKVPSAT